MYRPNFFQTAAIAPDFGLVPGRRLDFAPLATRTGPVGRPSKRNVHRRTHHPPIVSEVPAGRFDCVAIPSTSKWGHADLGYQSVKVASHIDPGRWVSIIKASHKQC